MIRIGIDIGGTFTDFVVFRTARALPHEDHLEDGQLESFKLLSTPDDPSRAVLEGLARILGSEGGGSPPQQEIQIVHGSTVATNALLERKGARAALIATRGFGDLLEIARQNRPALYDFFASPAPALVPPELRFEVSERVSAQGEVLEPLDQAGLDSLAGALRRAGAESAAVCLLFSFLRPEHEQQVGRHLRREGCFVSLSSEILPEFREYERASTTAANAYVSPVMDRYLSRLDQALPSIAGVQAAMRVMQSNGGQISLPEARRAAVRCILSGPAGGITGAQRVAALASTLGSGEAGEPLRLITFDMGGTSTDVSLIDGEPQLTTESVIGGCPIAIPVLDIHTIGAGGGSIASVDLGGALRVGPESAGADPGPACYGRGELPTVTDANLVLGRLAAEHFLGGEMQLDASRALRALESLGRQLGLDARQAALGVTAVANAHMERALRLISVERGRDPGKASGRPFTLLSFGGAGGLHAADLARRLGIPFVLVSPLASTLSAFGMLAADTIKDYSQTVMLPGEVSFEHVTAVLEKLADRALVEMAAEGFSRRQVQLERLLDLRYAGQSYELAVPLPDAATGLAPAFHRAHQAAYGYDRPKAALEIVNVRLRAVGPTRPPPLLPMPDEGPDASQAYLDTRLAVGPSGEDLPTLLFRFENLRPGNRLSGPALVARADTTVWLAPGDEAVLDGYGNLKITVAE